jgi:Matrixin
VHLLQAMNQRLTKRTPRPIVDVVWFLGLAVLLASVVYTWDGRRWVPPICELNIAVHLLPPAWRKVMQTAMNDWNGAGTAFRFTQSDSSSNIVTCFDHGNWNGRIAVTNTYPAQRGGVLTDVQITINTYYHFDVPHPPPQSGRDQSGVRMCLENVLKHELGHALFLGHSTDRMAIMFATPPQPSPPMPLGVDDISGLRMVYPWA